MGLVPSKKQAEAGAQAPAESNSVAVLTYAAKTIARETGKGTFSALAIGSALADAKDVCPHGTFGRWLTAKTPFSLRTAQSYMQADRIFGSNAQRVAGLEVGALFLLSTVSDPIRDAILARLDAGERITREDIRKVIAETRPPKSAKPQWAKIKGDGRSTSEAVASAVSLILESDAVEGDRAEWLCRMLENASAEELGRALIEAVMERATSPAIVREAA